LEGIPIEALVDPTSYRRPQEVEEAEQTEKTFLESKQNRTSTLRDLNVKPKYKRSNFRENKICFFE
jgi:hypothetical protein